MCTVLAKRVVCKVVQSTAMNQELNFSKIPQSLIALEKGTHSPRVSRLLTELGYK
jgi:hypothetical protein